MAMLEEDNSQHRSAVIAPVISSAPAQNNPAVVPQGTSNETLTTTPTVVQNGSQATAQHNDEVDLGD